MGLVTNSIINPSIESLQQQNNQPSNVSSRSNSIPNGNLAPTGYSLLNQQQQQQQQQPHQQQHSSSSRSHSGTGSQANLANRGGSSSGHHHHHHHHSGNQSDGSQSEDLTQLEPQIEAAYEAATGQRRQSVIKRQVITIPGQPGRVQQVVRRLPTPTPDVIERVFIVKPQRDTVNLIIERPSTPPAQYKDKTVYGKQRRPLINPKIIQVPSRQGPIGTLSSYYPYYTQQQGVGYAQYPSFNMQALQHQATSTTTSSSYQFQPQNPAMSQVSQQQQQYATQPTMSQGNSSSHHSTQSQSQSQLSEASHTRMSDSRLSQQQQQQPQQATSPQPPKVKGAYLVAPVKYEDSQQQQQQLQQQPLSYMMPTSYPNYASYGYYPTAYPTSTTPYGTRIY